jgi:hypothetical protein
MPQTVLLTEIVEALEFQVDEGLSVIDVEKGEVVYVSRDLLSMAEEGTRTKAKRVWMMMSGRKPSG